MVGVSGDVSWFGQQQLQAVSRLREGDKNAVVQIFKKEKTYGMAQYKFDLRH